MADDPQWLRWARELQSIAQAGLTYGSNPYDLERYGQLRSLAAAMLAQGAGLPVESLTALLAGEAGYATPKLDVRGAVFNKAGELLMVREVSDGHRWTLPGGWADVNRTPAECVIKEVREESGYAVRVAKLAALWDRTTQGHAAKVFSCWKAFFLCTLSGGEAATSLETSGTGWFAEHDLPTDLSLQRVLPHQLHRMFEHHRNQALPTEFD